MNTLTKLTPDMGGIVENRNGQLSSVSGPKAVEAFRLRVMISAVHLEKSGMRHMRKMMKLAKQETGLKTRDRDVLIAALQQKMEALLAEVVIVNDGE